MINFRVAIKKQLPNRWLRLPIASVPSCAKGCSPGLLSGQTNARDQSLLWCFAQSPEILGYGRNLNVLPLESRAPNDFYGVFGNLLSHVDTKGDTHQIGVLKLHPWPFVPVIEQNVVSGRFQLPGDVFGGGTDGFVLGVGRYHHHLERSDGRRQPEAVLVVTLLDGRGQDALDSNPVTAHDRRDLLAIPVEHAGAHGFRLLVAELEDVPNLDGGINAQGRITIRAIFARSHAAQVNVGRRMKSLPRRQVLDMIILFV